MIKIESFDTQQIFWYPCGIIYIYMDIKCDSTYKASLFPISTIYFDSDFLDFSLLHQTKSYTQ